MGNWLATHPTIASSFAAAALGAIAWSGHAITLPLSFGFLPLTLIQPNRWSAYGVAFSYYAASTWSLVPGAKTFFGPNQYSFEAVALWLTASALLAAPWGLFHFCTSPARFWSAPLALGATSLPPLGLIGWASPLTSAGMLFPGTGWFGIIAIAFLPALVVRLPWQGLAVTGALSALASVMYPGDPPPPAVWVAVDTTFGRSVLEQPDPIREFQNAEWIQQRALNSNARVTVFPETVVPRWNDATEAFWGPTLATLTAAGKTIVFGTTVAVAGSPQRINGVVIRGAKLD